MFRCFGFAICFSSLLLACSPEKKETAHVAVSDSLWLAPDSTGADYTTEIRYGYKLVNNTAYYLGPSGILGTSTNGLQCRNCHLEAGRKPFGLNYGSVAANYPKFRARSGKSESISYRVNDCLQRSLNGKPLDTTSAEMKAIVSYITWLGQKVPKGQLARGSGLTRLEFMDRAADTLKGRTAYMKYCRYCHGDVGQGLTVNQGKSYVYPPLWGKASYNSGAGMSRISNLAAFIYRNMPQGINPRNPVLTVEEAWDIAAFINSRERPYFDDRRDWPDKATKPFDFPHGPYADTFSDSRHKYGPYKAIVSGSSK